MLLDASHVSTRPRGKTRACIFISEKETSLLLGYRSEVTHCFPFCLGCQEIQNEPCANL